MICSTERAGQPCHLPEVRAQPQMDPLYLEELKDHAEEEMWSPGGPCERKSEQRHGGFKI